MGDSFIFTEALDTITPSNSSGFNGFPFKYGVNGTGPFSIGRRFPVAIPLQDCGVLWWRAKNYSVSTDITATYNSLTASYPNGAMTPAPTNASRELDLTDSSRTHVFDGLTLYDHASQQMILDAALFYAYIYLSFVVTPDISNPDHNLELSTDSGEGPFAASIPMTISGLPLGATINLTLYLADNGLDSFAGTHFDLTIIDTWPY